jgi:tetratricopeptide (TPR) repeat protein
LTRRKRRHKRRSGQLQGQKPRSRQKLAELEATLYEADDLITRGDYQAAFQLLEPLAVSHPREAHVHQYLGYARAEVGDSWGAISAYEQAMELGRDASLWLPLALLYLETRLRGLALNAFRQALEHEVNIPELEKVRRITALLEQGVAEIAHTLDLSPRQVELGLHHMDRGQLALHENDFPVSIAASQQAIRVLGAWPPPHNNLSQALFWNGQPEEAIAVERQVLSRAPENIPALSNAIRFLAWTGQEAEARALWTRLRKITPKENVERFKIAEAAASLGEDESVYRVLRRPNREQPAATGQMAYFLAVAEANTGRRRSAQRRLAALQSDMPWAQEILEALKAGRSGLGWTDRFPYFRSLDLIPTDEMEKFIELIEHQDDMRPGHFRAQVQRFVARFPQIILVAEKMIWEDALPASGIPILTTIATPATYATLRRFGLSQAGDDDTRISALTSLTEVGEITEDTTLRVWIRGEWREVQLRRYDVSDEHESEYSQEVADLLDHGLSAFQQDDHKEAEHFFEQALKLNSRAKEAYNNLGAIYARRGEHDRAREMFQAAVEIDPTYVFPRCNLAIYLLNEDDLAGALDMLAPLADMAHFRPQEMAFYSYTQARILVRQEEYEAAHKALEVALKVYPGYGPAEELMDRLAWTTQISTGFRSWMEKQQKRDQAKRARLQARLSTPDPSLSEALPLYTKDALTGMGHKVIPWDGWSALRKAEMVDQIVKALTDPENLARFVASMDDNKRDALRQVLLSDGSMPWQDFDARYGNDLGESPYWNWHDPETVMGQLRVHGLVVEATVDGELLVTVPTELRPRLREILG